MSIDHLRPNVPVIFTRGDLDYQRRYCIPTEHSDEVPIMAPARASAYIEDDPDKEREYQQSYHELVQWLTKVGVKASKLEERYVKATGEHMFYVHFPTEITDVRDYRQKRTLQFTAFGRHHARIFGEEKAKALAYTAYAASHIGDPTHMRFGCGQIKWTGYHGDDKNEFYVYPFKEFAAIVNAPDFDWYSVTFTSMKEFCWNSVEIETTDQYVRCKCLGHPTAVPDGMSRDCLLYTSPSPRD